MGLIAQAGLRWDQVSELMFDGDPSHVAAIIAENIEDVRNMIYASDIVTTEIELEIPVLSEAQKADIDLPPWRRTSA